MRALFLSVFFILGLLLVSLSTWNFISSPSLEEERNQRAGAAAWPSVQGTLREVHFQQVAQVGKTPGYYYVEVGYGYRVDGQDYQGDRLALDRLDNPALEVLEASMGRFVSPEHVLRRVVTEHSGMTMLPKKVSLYLREQAVTVYYDPKNPRSALLDPLDHHPPNLLERIAPLLVLIPIGIVMMVAAYLNWGEREASVLAWASRRSKKQSNIAVAENIQTYPPEECLLDLATDQWGGGMVFPAKPVYRCRRCGAVTAFGLRAKEPPEFSYAIRKAFDRASGAGQAALSLESEYCDFVCAKCGQPVRVLYRTHEFAMSCYRHLPEQVLVYEPPPLTVRAG